MALIQMQYLPVDEAMQLDNCFARFHFATDGSISPGGQDFVIPLRQLGLDQLDTDQPEQQAWCEVWSYPGEHQCQDIDGLHLVCCDDYLLLMGYQPDTDDLQQSTRALYARMLPLLNGTGFSNVVKMWNYLPGINIGEGDQERYKQFCLGRAEAFVGAGMSLEAPPAGTAVGCPQASPLCIAVLAARSPIVTLENPRQVSAYEYPRQYGPRSPSFSRAAMISNGAAIQVYLSGTAAIVGHESQHDDDVTAQANETLQNLRALLARAADQCPPGRDSLFRLYLREPDSLSIALASLESLRRVPKKLMVLQADICRRELMLEVDGLVSCTSRLNTAV